MIKIDGEISNNRFPVLKLRRNIQDGSVELITFWEGSPVTGVLFSFNSDGSINSHSTLGTFFNRDAEGYPSVDEI